MKKKRNHFALKLVKARRKNNKKRKVKLSRKKEKKSKLAAKKFLKMVIFKLDGQEIKVDNRN